MVSIRKMRKPLFLLVGVIPILILCLPACTGTATPTTTGRISGMPYTRPSGGITSPAAPGVKPANPIPTAKTILEPVTLPPDMTGRISEMLKYVPDIPEAYHAQVWFIDFAAWDETFGINRDEYRNSQGNTITDSENAYIRDLILSPFDSHDTTRRSWYPWLGWTPMIGGMGTEYNAYTNREILLKMPIRTANIGYGPLDLDRSIVSFSAFQNLPHFYEAIQGNFNTTEIDRVARNYQDDKHSAIISSYQGVNIYSWDEEQDWERILNPPVFNESGEGLTLALKPRVVLGCTEAKAIDGMIDASQGKVKSLADDPQYSELAAKLEMMGTMSAVISARPLETNYWASSEIALHRELSEKFQAASLYAPLMGPYVARAAGLGADEQGMFVSLALLYESPDQAENDVKTLENRLAKGMNSTDDPWKKEVESFEIWSDGNTLCAKLYGNVTNYWDCFMSQEPLLVTGDGGE